MAYLGGATLNFAAGDNRGIKIAAQTVLVALRVVECVENYAKLQIHYNALVEEIKGYAIAPLKPSWKQWGKPIILTPAAFQTLQDASALKCYRFKRIVYLCCMVAFHIFDLSMCVYDASQAMNLDNDFINDNINEIFLNGIDLWNKLTSDLPYLALKLHENTLVIDSLLQNISRSPIKTSHLIKVCRGVAAIREKVHNAASAVKGACIYSAEKVAEGARKATAAIVDKDYIDPKIRYIDDSKISPPLSISDETPCGYSSRC